MATVAFIGLGRMGAPMAKHVVDAGHETRVFDVRAEATDPLVAAGAHRASSPAEAADGADFCVVAVLNDAQMRAVTLEPEGALATLAPGAMLLAHSTLEPATVDEVAAAAQSRGVDYLDAPMSGGVPGAQAGTLMIIAGGEQSAIDRAAPVLSTYSDRTVHCGPTGAGTYAKLGRNATGYALMTAVAEGMAIATSGGVAPATFLEVIDGSDVLTMYEAAKMTSGSETRPFDRNAHGPLEDVITTAHKDLRQAIVAGRNHDIDLPMLRGVLQNYSTVFGIDLAPADDILDGLDD